MDLVRWIWYLLPSLVELRLSLVFANFHNLLKETVSRKTVRYYICHLV